MPIIIPTTDEIQRMDARQRAALARRIRMDKARAKQSIDLLTHGSILGSAIATMARDIHARTPPDPDAQRHVLELLQAIGPQR